MPFGFGKIRKSKEKKGTAEKSEGMQMEQEGKKKTIVWRLLCQKRTSLLLCGIVGVILLETAKRSSFFAEEIFAKRIFKALSVGISFFTGWLPFSLAEVSVILCPFAVMALIGLFLYRFIKEKQKRFFLCLNTLYGSACVAAFVFFVYAVGCGINYYRYPFSYYAGLTVEPSEAEVLYAVCAELTEEANALRRELTCEDENGVYQLSVTKRELGILAKEAYMALAEEYAVLGGIYPVPKQLLLSKLMSYTELTGIYTCWTMEANVNADIPDYSIGSTMAHELAHLRGFIREDEANYIAYLACMASDNAELRYSGVMDALIMSGNALYRKNPDLYFALRSTYEPGIERDLAANSAYWAKYHDTVVSNTVDKANDTYLKANNQTDGVESYGRMVDLLIAEYKKRMEE